ncbi:MAG: EAL domain-containing protein [Actinomycetota bacterium]
MPMSRPSLRRSTITSRLAILVSLPLFGVVALVAIVAQDAHRDMVAAQDLRRDSQLVDLLSEIAVTADAEADGYDAILAADAMGVPLGSGLGGLSISSEIWADSGLTELIPELERRDSGDFADPEATDRLLVELEHFVESVTSSEPPTEGELDRMRATIGRNVERALTAQLAQLDAHFAQVDPPAELLAVHATLGPIRELRAAAREQRIAAALYLLPIADEADGTESERFRRLVAAAADYDAKLAAVVEVIPDRYRMTLGTATEADNLAGYQQLVSDALTGRVQPVSNDGEELLSLIPTGMTIFLDGLTAITELSDLDAQLTADFLTGSARVEADASSRLTQVVLIATLLAVAMISISYLTIRSITTPVERLLARAHRITNGHLDPVAGSRADGPTDIALVHHALDEMTANLATLSDQAEALSAGRLDDEVLNHQVAGRLGESLHGSVARLRLMTARLEREATHDSLTGLPNRAAVMALLEHLLTGAEADRQPLAVIMLDLDGFKQANDNLGHTVGDEVLCNVGARLVARSGGHFVARLGGDEFMMVVTAANGDDPLGLAHHAIRAVAEPMRLSVGTTMVSASAGIVRTNANNWLTPSEILRRVDLALYEAKADTPGAVVEFDQRLHDSLLAATQLSGELRSALHRNEFFLVAQPIFDVNRGRLHGFESLIRWRSPVRGLVPPDMFIGVAEQSELITHIDTWVIHQTAAVLSSWQSTPGLDDLSLSVNISARHLSRPELPVELEEAIDRNNLVPSSYVVEITESQLIPNLVRAEDNLRRMKDLGVQVAIDDFGTGYASVAHLRSVDFDRLKIDRSFLTHLDDETDRSLATLLVSLGRDLELDVVAEGIETEAQLNWAQGAGCSHGQGYLLGRPEPIEDVTTQSVAELAAKATSLGQVPLLGSDRP